MLRLRLAEGLGVRELDEPARAAARLEADAGRLDRAVFDDGRLVLTRQGRLLADGVARRLLG
jgi:oxygen-independent coproporphyrinogen-3 oxidase